MKLHVILQGVASVKPLGAEMTGEGHLSAVDEHVLLQMMLHTEPLWTLGTCERSGRIFGGRVVLEGAVGGRVDLV